MASEFTTPPEAGDVGYIMNQVSLAWFKQYCFPHFEFMIIQIAWFLYCSSSPWDYNRYLRAATLLEGIAKAILDFWMTINNTGDSNDPPIHVYTVSMFMTYVLGRMRFSTSVGNTCQRNVAWTLDVLARATVLVWLVLDMLTPIWQNLRFFTINLEGALVLGFLVRHWYSVSKMMLPRRWFLKVFRVCLWAGVWGIITAAYWVKYWKQYPAWQYTELPFIVWFMTYEILFPRTQKESPSQARIDPMANQALGTLETSVANLAYNKTLPRNAEAPQLTPQITTGGPTEPLVAPRAQPEVPRTQYPVTPQFGKRKAATQTLKVKWVEHEQPPDNKRSSLPPATIMARQIGQNPIYGPQPGTPKCLQNWHPKPVYHRSSMALDKRLNNA